MGEVWRSLDQHLHRPVAVKVIRDDIENPVAGARFRREATIGARLRHPGITVVHDIGRDADRLFIVMELLEGIDLAALIAGAPDGLPVDEVVALATQVAEGLAAAHEQGVVHRDLKPANLFLHRGHMKICDFGIARANDLTAGLTGPNGPGGTALYMAPEQWRGEQTDERCDLYAFGCVLYHLLTGTPPFAGNRYVLMRRHVEEAPRPLRTVRPDMPLRLEALVAGLLEKNPPSRPSTADVLAVLSSMARDPVQPLTAEAPTAHPGQNVLSPGVDLLLDFRDRSRSAAASGDFVMARQMAEISVEVSIRLLGPDHHDTLANRLYLAQRTGQAGDQAGARDLLETLVTDRTRVLGADHPVTLHTRQGLAFYTGQTGDLVGARDLLQHLLADEIRVLGSDHPNTLITRLNLAINTGLAGDPAGARDLLEMLVSDMLRVLGADHPDTLFTRHRLAEYTGQAGDPVGAGHLFETLVTDETRVLGADHPETAFTRGRKAAWAAVHGTG